MATFFKLATVAVGAGGASSIDFTSIPQTYTDLCIKISLRETAAVIDGSCFIKFNGGSSPSVRYFQGNGSGGASGTTSNYVAYIGGANETANTFGNGEIYIPNYAGSSNKSYASDSVNENNASTAYMILIGGLWANTAAITSIALTPTSGQTFVQYSSATLYGIKKD